MSTDGIEPTPKSELKPVSILKHLTKHIALENDLDGWFEKLGKYGPRMNLNEFLAHLHIGFEMYPSEKWRDNPHPATYYDLVRCYLDMADGYCGDDDFFFVQEDREGLYNREGVEYFHQQDERGNKTYLKPKQIRQLIAQKAMKELVIHFFKKYLPEEGKVLDEDWAMNIVKVGLLTDLQHFFRVEKRYDDWRIINLRIYWGGPTSDDKILISFLLNLAKFLWEWKGILPYSWANEDQTACKKANDDFQAKLDQAKPWMIEVLEDLGKLPILNKYLLQLDQACLDKLEEIALRTKLDHHKYPVKKDHLAQNLEEAWYASSPAAALLMKRISSIKTEEKLRKVHEAEREKEEAERKLAELKSGQQ